MTDIWNNIVNLVDNHFTSDDCVIRYNEEDISLESAISNLLEKSDCTQYAVTDETAFDSCGYSTGFVFAAWIEKNGDLNNIIYQWETK